MIRQPRTDKSLTNVAEFKKFHYLLMAGAPQNYSPWYFKCRPGRKDPIRGVSWKHPRHKLSFEQAVEWMQSGGNIGIGAMKCDQLVNVDLDGNDVRKQVLKPTLISRSRSRTGLHGYYFSEPPKPPNITTDKYGEVRSQNYYVLAPGSYVTTSPNEVPKEYSSTAGYYTIEDARKPSIITLDELPEVFKKKMRQNEEAQTNQPKPSTFDPKKTGGKHSAVFDITAKDIAVKEGGDIRPMERWPALFHDSTTDANMSLSQDGLLHCWRHNVSLNGLQALAVLSGFMTCDEAGSPHKDGGASPSAIIGNNAAIFHAWKYAKEAGYISDDDPMPTRAMKYIAKKHFGHKSEKDERLPAKIYTAVLECMVTEYPGLPSGRKIRSETSQSCDDNCIKCGTLLNNGLCPSCNWERANLRQVIPDYIVEATNGNYLLRSYETDRAVYTFKTTGSGTARDISKTLCLDLNLVKQQLAEIVDYEEKMRPLYKMEEQEEEKNFQMVPTLHTDDFIAEQIWDGKSAPKFVLKYFDRDGFEYVDHINLGEFDDRGRPIIYVPVYTDHLTKGMVLIPKEPKPCTIREVIEDAFTYVTNPRFYDSCGKNLEVKTLVLICIGSWFIERMIPQTSVPVAGVGRFAPILPIRGPSESGKNRLANLLRFVSYHPYFDLSKTAVPSLFRPLDIWKGTLIMDEADIKNSGATSQLIQFLNSRAYGTPISRQNPEKISVSHVFQSFGLTIVTQRQHFDDNATESRSVPYYSEKTTTKLPTIEENEVVEQGLNLQDKLLYLRLTLWKTVTVDKAKWHQELSDHRLNSALLTVFALAEHEPWIMTIIDQTVKSIERAKRRRKAVSIDGQLINYLWGKLNESLWDTRDGNYYILNEIQTYADNEENTNETKTPLIATNIKDELGLGYKTIRKVWDSVNISPDDVPDRIRVGTRTYRVFWFKPDRLEKMLREFVLDYEYYNLYELIGLPKPEPVTDVTDVTGSREGGNLTSCIVGEDAVAKQTLPCISSDALNQHQLGEWVHAVEAKEADNIDRDNSLSPDLSQVSHLSQNMPSNEQTAKSVPVSESVENSHLSLKDPWSYTCCICNNEIQLDEGFKPYNIGKEKLWAHMDCLKEHPEGNKQ